VQTVVNIVVLASIYALISCGYVLIYKVSRVLNLAHGELMLLGAYVLMATTNNISPNPWIAIAIAAVLAVVVGLLVYVLLMRKMTGQSVLAAVLTTIAFGILMRGIMILVWSPQQHNIAKPLGILNSAIEILPGARISSVAAALVLVTAAVYAALFAFLQLTRWGMRMRAAGQNPLLAAQRGIELHVVYALAWCLSTFTGALAGMLIAMDSRLDSTMAVIGLKAFPAALVGGLDSLLGALIGSLIIAGAEVLMIQWVNPLLSDVVPFFVLIAMLIVRPWGLFGTREQLDRV
jgi:branched-chain amino acid transport system permease protein